MTQREGGSGSPEKSADETEELDPTEVDGEDAAAGGGPDGEALPNEDAGHREFDEAVADGGTLGDANDALPSSGRAPASVTPARGSRAARRNAPAPAKSAAAPTPSELAVRIDDRVSMVFVVISVGFFILLFAYALLFGGSGALTPKPTPRPIPTFAPSPSATESPSASASVAPSVAPSASVAPSDSTGPSPSST